MRAHEPGDWLRRVPEAVFGPLVRLLWGFEVFGRENLPPGGPLIVASNHCSVADGPLLVMAAGIERPLRFPGKIELFRVPLMGRYLSAIGMIPLDRRTGGVGAMRAALEVLSRGGCLGLFPEGTRSKTGLPGPARAGLGFLAGRSRAPVATARLFNTFGFPLRRPVSVRFGPLLRFEGDPEDRRQCLQFGERVMDAILALPDPRQGEPS